MNIPCLNVSVPLLEEKECGVSLRALTIVKNWASEYVNVCAGVCVGVYEGQNSPSLFLADIPVFIQFIMIYLKVQYMIYWIMITLF